ncbi:phosphatidylserine/phosphatidylglycerophosphate/cardiolipin synthase family protein [Luteolibacter flavescens]|uniref:Phosphatidylserine/phosphatidylglycerophosphate/ cardiolipin synthase family protein n=1 Tax=Luteolibacter flavescens TaxID=1859460 RepID=A0ABT3FMR9_9BACT|nr:phosphatidylserine/phosphatidylglycerophosphate/cardiolipin synthase family protein [Luteolibacter flavescens]MCW1884853.1 phosphatidylserine/phosphatidylglycerophosphate/cardiolipin synthase family protein [Luteolibacter flavescens]
MPRLLLPLSPLLFSACASLHSNADRSTDRRPAASDPVTGNTQLVVSAFRATTLAAVRQPYTTVRTGLAVFWHRPKEIVSGNIPVRLELTPPPTEVPGTPEFEALLDRSGLPETETGRLTWLVDGPGFFPEFDRQLEAAQHRVDMQFFIYDNDDIAVKYSDRLKAKAEKVPVRILFDDLGSTFAHTAAPETPAPPGFVPPPDIAAYLKKDSELEVRRTLNPWLVCDHTKLLVFDHRVAFMGGMNMGREYYSEWHDLMVKVEGPIVGTLQREFSRAWRKAGPWGDLAMFQKPRFFREPKPVADGVPLRLLRTDAAAGQEHVLKATLLGIRAAKKRIWIENPYFAHDDIAIALEAAARRGVDVRVILPARGDSTIMDVGNLGTARGLIAAGARVYRYPKMTHMKVMICDGWAQIGSANLDILSMRINRELNIAFSDPATLRELERKVFLPDFRASERIRYEETTIPIAPIAEAVADQL